MVEIIAATNVVARKPLQPSAISVFHRKGRRGREGLPRQKLLLSQSFASFASFAVNKTISMVN